MADPRPDAVVVGAGPNGLAAAITLAREGRSVVVYEAGETPGGGCRSAELTLPGYVHDVCSAVHPLAAGSLFFRQLPLQDFGLELVHPDVPLAHPLDGMEPALMHRSIQETAAGLGRDGAAYSRLFGPLTRRVDKLLTDIHGPLPIPPRHPFVMASFGLRAMLPATTLAKTYFREPRTRAMVTGLAGHAIQPMTHPFTGAAALLLGTTGHAFGWPFVRGGSQALTSALVAYLESLGGEVVTGHRVESIRELPPAPALLFDVTPKQLLTICGEELGGRYARALRRYRYGPGVFKVDWALNAPIPWRDEGCRRAGSVHLAGTMEELTRGEQEVWDGKHPEHPFVLLAQPTLADPTRAPGGKHTVWAYCHVPNGSDFDMTDRIEAQVERFAPGFRDVIEARSTMNTKEMESYDSNYVGGDINAGVQDVRQLFTRPAVRVNPYTTPNPRIFICSSSTPPGGGVHGMCGYYAAKAALKGVLR